MNKLKKTAMFIIILIFIAVFYLVDQYIYSWTGWLAYQAGTCKSKSITLSAAKKDGFKRLAYPLDLVELTGKLKSNPNYLLNSTETSVSILRKFDDFDYQISFENRTVENEMPIYYQLFSKGNSSIEGEKCTTPDFEIYKKVYQMIDDLPLGDKTRRDIISSLTTYHQN